MKINNNIAKIYKLSAYKNLNLWNFTREMEALDRFMKKGNSKMDEDKPLSRKERFKKYREARLGSAVHAIKLCENMANKNSYEYTEDEARTIIKHLEEAVRSLKHAFASADKNNKKRKFF